MEPHKSKVLFIADKWCGGNKKYGLSEWESSLWMSLKTSGLAEVDVFHFDDYFMAHGKMADEAFLQKISEYRPEMICLVTNKMPGTATNVPALSTFNTIKNKLKLPIIAVWADLEVKEQVEISKALSPYTVLNMATASTAALKRINRPDKYIQVWSPKDPLVFNNPDKVRDIDVGYLGSPRKDRLAYIMYLVNHDISVVYGGGEGQEHLTTEQYADRYKRSKIALSFARAHASHVVNTRPYEVMLCGAMLLEQESFELMKRYTPYIDYVPYSNKKDMLEKAKYFLTHDEAREKIAKSGQKKTEGLYSAKVFWQIALDRALRNGSLEANSVPYPIPEESLNKLSTWTAFKMKFLNTLCSTRPGFGVYLLFSGLFWKQKFNIVLGESHVLLKKLLPKKVFSVVLNLKHKLVNDH